ncbi:LysR family transcriptional regulator [Psychrobium sp. 1_MG-2023]|uniref:LysR family transcriptional regulator n=1 Tax=Psychrobium sp. 1_MG-2023 TaxID=3062624 RepID=UPI000C343868|nr:LysR family transcriptional regulator [Psychrobium sp. 1_MG-2023]MDP2561449.1 LysR family transcriptional regulator [Psychrobium sp. 1_MG-2023]PKF57716.1 LysR family transcriptional regulator [Alteromonadales bacterium alter-6D02]
MNWDDLKIFLEVARTETLQSASGRLKIDSSTVSRRIHKLEKDLKTQLFSRGAAGHSLTPHGEKLFNAALEIEQKTESAMEILQGKNLQQTGDVRVGTTDAFGNFFIAGQLASFFKQYPNINVDLLPLQRFVKLTQHEADIAITIEKPTNPALVVSKLCDYRLKMYASREYLIKHPAIKTLDDLDNHPLIGYVDDLIFSDQLCYLDRFLAHKKQGHRRATLRSTSVIAQASAVKSGAGLAILPCFLADSYDNLIPILNDEIDIVRHFWIAASSERMALLRVQTLWRHLQDITDAAQAQLLGKS